MKIIGWIFIGRATLELWLALTPAEKLFRLEVLSAEFAEQQSCGKIQLKITVDDKDVYFAAQCSEIRL